MPVKRKKPKQKPVQPGAPMKKKPAPGLTKAVSNKKYNKKSNPSQTTKQYSNTNTVKAGKKGASGVMAIPTPKKKKAVVVGGKKRSTVKAKGNKPAGKPKPGNVKAEKKKEKKPMTGNPGNAKPKGRAGEKEEKGMYPGGGVRGRGDNVKPKKPKKNK